EQVHVGSEVLQGDPRLRQDRPHASQYAQGVAHDRHGRGHPLDSSKNAARNPVSAAWAATPASKNTPLAAVRTVRRFRSQKPVSVAPSFVSFHGSALMPVRLTAASTSFGEAAV